MRHFNPYNQPEKFKQRFVFFANKGEGQEGGRVFTLEQERYLKELESMSGSPHAKEIAHQYRTGKIETEVLEEAREILRNPNKMDQEPYKRFMKALAKGKFPNRAKHALQFLRALNGSEKERDYANDLVKDLSDDATGPLSERREKAHLKKLAELKQEDIAETITRSVDVRSAAMKASETADKNWQVEDAPKDLIEVLDRLELKQAEIARQANAKDKELEKALRAEKPDKVLIARLEKEIKALDEQFDALAKELEAPKLEFQNYLERNLARYDALENFLDRAGIDINAAKKLKMWFLQLSSRKESTDAKTSLKMQGIVIDSVTGQARKQETTIEITGIRFEKDRSDLEASSPGELIIEYTNEKGEATYAGYKNFLQMVDAFEAYEEVDSLDDVNRKLAREIGYIDLSQGQEFQADVLIGLDENGKELRETHKFTIETIDVKKKKITLNRSVKKIPREWIGLSVDPSLYFDRNQREFSFGEFIKLVKQHKYTREIAVAETASALQRSQALLREDCEAFVEDDDEKVKAKYASVGGIPDTKLTVPEGESTGKVVFLDEHRQRRTGVLRRGVNAKGEEVFTLEPQIETLPGTTDEGNADESDAAWKALSAAGIPLGIATAKPGRGRWQKKDLSARALMEMANKGHIADHAPAAEHGAEHGEPHETGHEEHAEHEEHGEDQGEDHGKPKQKIYEEALPYDAVYKTGGMDTKKASLLKSMWIKTKFLSIDDVWEMGKAMWEYYDNRFKRRQKERYSKIGTELPFFAPEMRRVNQAAENEQVNQFKESFEHKGEFEVFERLTKTHNRDEMKACFLVLSEKGQLRWDYIDVWRNINRFVDAKYAIPIPGNGDPYTRISKDDPRTGFDFLKAAIDSMWGEGQYNEWFSGNKSHFQSHAKGYYEEGKELEGVDGGHTRRLATLLQQHKRGEYVDPHEYEGLILHSIEAGKSNMQSKIYYMIEGVAVTNSHGHTILPFERLAHINSEMLTRFPILEYLCASVPRPDGKGRHRWTMDDYKQWVKMFDEGDVNNPARNRPGPGVDRFMWDYVIPSDETQNRINKAIRNGETLDHDDMFAYLPPATEEVVTDACKATTGSKKFLTLEGYANAFPGFNQYMKALAGKNNRNKLREAIKSYVRFEGIMKNRFEKEKDVYQRMSYATLNGATIVSDSPPQAFINQLNPMVKEVIAAYNDSELNTITELIYTETGDIFSNSAEREKQNRINDAFRRFADVFNRVIKTDNGEKMTAIVAGTTLEGIPFGMSEEEKAKRKAAYSDNLAL